MQAATKTPRAYMRGVSFRANTSAPKVLVGSEAHRSASGQLPGGAPDRWASRAMPAALHIRQGNTVFVGGPELGINAAENASSAHIEGAAIRPPTPLRDRLESSGRFSTDALSSTRLPWILTGRQNCDQVLLAAETS